MPTTPTYSFPYPASTDTADGPDAFYDLALAIENQIKALPVVHYGTSDPSAGLGKNGDVYVKYQ